MPIINSVAFPKVALSKPPKFEPSTTAISSVAVPIQAARGMMARADVMKIVEDSQPRKCPAIETGINNSRLEIIVVVFGI